MKHDAIVEQGIPIYERVPIPDGELACSCRSEGLWLTGLDMIPEDSRVEIDAKIHSGYFSAGKEITEEDLKQVKGRGWESWEDVTVSEHEPDEEYMTADMSFSIDWHFCILLNIDIL